MNGLERGLVAVGLAVFVAAAGPRLSARPQAPADGDPVLGVWQLNLAKSTYRTGEAPKSQKRTYELHSNGIKTTVETVDADGQASMAEFVAQYDSIQYPVTGSAEVDGVALKRINPQTAEATISHAGRTVGTARRLISPDGKTLTLTFRDAKGALTNVAVYDKVK